MEGFKAKKKKPQSGRECVRGERAEETIIRERKKNRSNEKRITEREKKNEKKRKGREEKEGVLHNEQT